MDVNYYYNLPSPCAADEEESSSASPPSRASFVSSLLLIAIGTFCFTATTSTATTTTIFPFFNGIIAVDAFSTSSSASSRTYGNRKKIIKLPLVFTDTRVEGKLSLSRLYTSTSPSSSSSSSSSQKKNKQKKKKQQQQQLNYMIDGRYDTDFTDAEEELKTIIKEEVLQKQHKQQILYYDEEQDEVLEVAPSSSPASSSTVSAVASPLADEQHGASNSPPPPSPPVLQGPDQRTYLKGVTNENEECVVAYDVPPVVAPQQQQQQQAASTISTTTTTTQEIDLHGLEELAPLERQMLRMEGLEPYVLVSVLSSTTSYGTITGTAILKNGAIDMLSTALLATSTISTVCGVYSTVVFSMCILYGKTALGLDKEDAYYYFMEATSLQRFRGFKAFSYSLLLFVIDIFLIGVDKMPDEYQLAGGITAGLITVFGYLEFGTILEGAAPMFTGVIPGQEDQVQDQQQEQEQQQQPPSLSSSSSSSSFSAAKNGESQD